MDERCSTAHTDMIMYRRIAGCNLQYRELCTLHKTLDLRLK